MVWETLTVGPRHLWQLILRDHFHLALLNRVSFSLIVSSINNVAQTHRASSVCSLSPIFDTHVHFRIFETFPRHCSATCPGNTRSNHFFLHLFPFDSSNLPSFILPAKQHNLINYSPYVHAINTNKFSLTIRYNFREFSRFIGRYKFFCHFEIFQRAPFQRIQLLYNFSNPPTNYFFNNKFALTNFRKKKLRYKFFWHFEIFEQTAISISRGCFESNSPLTVSLSFHNELHLL